MGHQLDLQPSTRNLGSNACLITSSCTIPSVSQHFDGFAGKCHFCAGRGVQAPRTQELWEEKFGFAVHGWTRLQDHGAAPLPGQQQRPFSSDSASTHEKDAEYFLDVSYLLTKPEYGVPSWCVSTYTDVLGWMDFPGYF